MFNLFSKPDPKEQQREVDRNLRKVGRDMERDRRMLEQEEKKIELEIKKLAKQGNKEGCAVLAKQLLQLRKQKARTYAANSKVQGISAQNKTMGANIKLAGAMQVAGKTMSDMNKVMRPEKIAADMNNFAKESMKMDMTDEMINDTLDEMLGESGDEEESDNVISKVLDEIGIEISGKVNEAPSALTGKVGESSKKATTDDDLMEQLSKLRS